MGFSLFVFFNNFKCLIWPFDFRLVPNKMVEIDGTKGKH